MLPFPFMIQNKPYDWQEAQTCRKNIQDYNLMTLYIHSFLMIQWTGLEMVNHISKLLRDE